mmetsp:Transcript_57476/g.133959  ORF Transcript_57476/g.133959 Transcript_57476/m.133959 type:complete len:234 (+) Transcript_57476:102-803(+)
MVALSLRPEVVSPWHRQPPGRLLATALFAGAAASAFAWVQRPRGALGFTLVSRGVASCARRTVVALHAEEEAPETAVIDMEAPPSDDEAWADGGKDPRPFRRFPPKRDIRGKLCYARRELNEEAERMRPYLEPLIERQLSLQEITFVLNRIGAKLRPLLYKPRNGLPIFTEHKVRRLLRRARTPDGRLNKFVRPSKLPPNAPGARYPPTMKDAYAEVPPLAPWSPPEPEQLSE